MPTLKKIYNHWTETVAPSILEQYRGVIFDAAKCTEIGCDNRWQACLKSVTDKLQIAENAIAEFPTLLDFSRDIPNGAHLDWLANFMNIKRLQGESDSNFFARFINSLGSDTLGTPNNIIGAAKFLSRSNSIEDIFFIDEVAATWFVYTPNGKQLYAQQAKTLTPAGVLGLVGAGILQGDGSLLADAEGNVILMVADDYDEHETNGILTEFGENILTETGDTLETEGA